MAARLRDQGHDVYPVTLTGLGERVHLARPEIDLETHIADVVNVIVWNGLDQVILAGHSYAGAVVTGVADRIPERLAQLVYVDSAPIASGMAMIDLYPPEALTTLAEETSLAGLVEDDRERIAAKAVAQLWATYTQPLRLRQVGEPPYQRVLIACDEMRGLVAAGVPEIAALTAPPWRYLELETGHWPMFSAPEELAALLHSLSRADAGAPEGLPATSR